MEDCLLLESAVSLPFNIFSIKVNQYWVVQSTNQGTGITVRNLHSLLGIVQHPLDLTTGIFLFKALTDATWMHLTIS